MPLPLETEKDEDADFYRNCVGSIGSFWVGYAELTGRYLSSIPQNEWDEELRKQKPRLAALMQRFEDMPIERAHSEVNARAVQVLFRAQDFLDYQAAKVEIAERSTAPPAPEAKKTTRATMVPIAEVVAKLVDQVAEPEATVSTPFPTLNGALLGGLRKGELVYLAARPGVGKSAMAVEWASHIAQRGVKVLIASREMTNISNARRMIAQNGKLSASSLRSGVGVDHHRFVASANTIASLPIVMSDNLRTVVDAHSFLQQDPEIGFVIVDYLQLIEAPAGTTDARLQLEKNSALLKRLALKIPIPILALSSITPPPGVSDNDDKPPTLLRGSRGIEHDADVILLLHRKKGALTAECVIAKNRDGQSSIAVQLTFHPEWVGFEEPPPEMPGGQSLFPPDDRRYGQ